MVNVRIKQVILASQEIFAMKLTLMIALLSAFKGFVLESEKMKFVIGLKTACLDFFAIKLQKFVRNLSISLGLVGLIMNAVIIYCAI
jgi:hypothetical protein